VTPKVLAGKLAAVPSVRTILKVTLFFFSSLFAICPAPLITFPPSLPASPCLSPTHPPPTPVMWNIFAHSFVFVGGARVFSDQTWWTLIARWSRAGRFLVAVSSLHTATPATVQIFCPRMTSSVCEVFVTLFGAWTHFVTQNSSLTFKCVFSPPGIASPPPFNTCPGYCFCVFQVDENLLIEFRFIGPWTLRWCAPLCRGCLGPLSSLLTPANDHFMAPPTFCPRRFAVSVES